MERLSMAGERDVQSGGVFNLVERKRGEDGDNWELKSNGGPRTERLEAVPRSKLVDAVV